MTTKAQRPRQVGVCLKHLPADDTSARFHHDNVPWQRVINAKGVVSPRFVLFPSMHALLFGADTTGPNRPGRVTRPLRLKPRELLSRPARWGS